MKASLRKFSRLNEGNHLVQRFSRGGTRTAGGPWPSTRWSASKA